MKSSIIYEDIHVLVCEKPVGMLVQSDRSMDVDMVNELKNYLYEKQTEKREPYLGLVHRLDRPVGGVLVFAKTPVAAKSLSIQVQGGEQSGKNPTPKMEKKYYAVIEGDLSDKIGAVPEEIVNYLVKDARTNTSKITNATDKNGKKAILMYQVLAVAKDESGYPISLVEVTLKTGRHHQIRVQMAGNQMPLWGDTKYNEAFVERQKQNSGMRWANVGLYSHMLAFTHPTSKKRLEFERKPKDGIFKQFDL
ncbi:RluA family pseudouridine synthase [Anaerosporobacter sp.]|uniref:RluA family pseudouridine synthase n=1 Tax=Anaerosporobacter sp. TaxID=1872529 RepID=UPI00286F843A|nr:RluA family pseudouridine synthase [Anaerosporobacter sp.]